MPQAYLSATVIAPTRDHFVNAPSQWEATLQCNVVSHWLGAFTKWSLKMYRGDGTMYPLQCTYDAVWLHSAAAVYSNICGIIWFTYRILQGYLTHCSLGGAAVILKVQFSNSFSEIVAWALAVRLLSGEFHRTLLVRGQHCFRKWLGVVR